MNGKVPILGDIPVLGRLFKSQGETTQKRNLLIFVTSNLISPGGFPSAAIIALGDARFAFSEPELGEPGGGIERGEEGEE